MLHYRSLILGVPAPRYWDMGEEDREFKFNNYISRYHSRHTDLMDLLAKYNGRANAPLDELAKLCGFPGKLGMDGSKVWEAWSQGRADEVRAYCETDVVNTWLVYTRFRFLRGELDPVSYEAEIALVRDTLSASDAPHWKEYLDAWKGRLTPEALRASPPGAPLRTGKAGSVRPRSGMIGIWGRSTCFLTAVGMSKSGTQLTETSRGVGET